MSTKLILIRLLLCLATAISVVNCSENALDERESKGGALPTVHVVSKEDLAHIKNVWGVDAPAPNAFLAKKAADLMVLMTSHDRLQPYEQSIEREWQQVSAGTTIRHEQFVVDGSTDTKTRYTKWKGEDGKMRYIVLDYSTGIISYFSLAD